MCPPVSPPPGPALDPETTVLAVDVGGTKLAAGLVDDSGRLLHAERAPTPTGGDGEVIWRELSGLCDRVAAHADGAAHAGGVGGAGLAGVGVGCGGPMRWPSGEVSPLNIAGWHGFPLRARLAERFAGLPVRIHNDAVCVTIAEHWLGAARRCANVLGMVVSTGVGGGLVLGGRLVDGGTGNAGHVGHIIVEPGGPPCGCGGRGCVEAVGSGTAVAGWALANGWRPPAGTAVPTAREVAGAARAGDPVARAAFERAGELVGMGIASAVALLDLDLVVVGGGLAQTGPLLFEPLRRGFRRHARVDFAARTRILPAALGVGAGLVGAAALIWHPDRYWSADRAG
ncbi:MAG TPA: ROK family protein [Mycobacteriales bacterium]|nr:ROK family protein [Mycobacteriales bacterium]